MIKIADYDRVRKFLITEGVDCILYGSLGTSVYLGDYRNFDDIDLLVDKKWVEEEWDCLVKIMNKNGFIISDEKEHEFIDDNGIKVAFADQNVLVRDGICDPIIDLVELNVNGITVRTLSKENFIKAYLFSSKDGYRSEKRGKNDLEIVDKLRSV